MKVKNEIEKVTDMKREFRPYLEIIEIYMDDIVTSSGCTIWHCDPNTAVGNCLQCYCAAVDCDNYTCASYLYIGSEDPCPTDF